MARYTDNKGEYFDWWFEDKKWILSIMYSNMASDLNCGYDPFGKSITEQKSMIDNYEKDIDDTFEKFKSMSESEIDHWCYYDMLKRGAIA